MLNLVLRFPVNLSPLTVYCKWKTGTWLIPTCRCDHDQCCVPWSIKGGGGREGNKGHILQIEMTEIHEIRSRQPSLSLRRSKTRLIISAFRMNNSRFVSFSIMQGRRAVIYTRVMAHSILRKIVFICLIVMFMSTSRKVFQKALVLFH